MKLLLDTHIFLWWLMDDRTLGEDIRSTISQPDTVVMVSAASIWEISIKCALGRLEVRSDLSEEIEANHFGELQISARHAWQAGILPPHHQDPFDRMLLAQARLEDLQLVTRDRQMQAYEVSVLLV